MEQGALIRKHSFDTVLLCCLICISFFAANTTYSDYIMGPDPYPNHRWVAETSFYQGSGWVHGFSKTSLNTNFFEYDKARVNATLTYLDGTQETQSNCANPSASVGWNFSVLPGRYEIQADHYVGTGSCTGTHVAHTSCIWDTTQVSIDYFYAMPQGIPYPGTATLYWGTTNGTSFNINGMSVPASGSMPVSPASSTIYTLTASNPYTSTQAKTSVRTNEPLTSHFYDYSVRHEKGVSPFFPYMQVGPESVNSANGNLHFTVPLLSRPGRNGLGVNLTLAYNSKIWDFFVQGSTLYATVPEYDSWVGLGWTLTMGRVIDDSANGKYYVTSSDGSNHVLKYYGGAWRSTDSTYMVYDPDAHKLTLKGGTNLRFDDPADVVRPYMRYATRIQDTNGNYLDIAYSGTGGRISAIYDTLGNTYSFLLDSSGRLQNVRYWNTKDIEQATGTISLDYQSIAPAFGSGATTDPMVMTQPTLYHVTYLTGVRYGFSYNSSGLLEQVAYPAVGAPSRYFYTKYTVLDRLLNRTVPDYYVTSHDTGAGTATWTWSTNPSGNAAPTTVGISIPESLGTTHYMQKSSTGWADGLITRIKKADSLSLEASQDWVQDDEQLTTIYNPRVAWLKRTTRFVIAPYTEKYVYTGYSYAGTADYSGNVKEIREYYFNGTILRRKTVIGYLHESNGSYAALNILDRVSSTLVYDGSNNLLSKATTTYDAATLYGAPNAIQHDTAFGTGYLTRGLPTSAATWHDIAQNDYIVSSIRYDECGNPREITDPQSNMTYSEYWLSASDNAYAFPLITVNAKEHVTETTYNYKSGVPLTTEDSNGKVTTMTYDKYDRVTQVTKQGDGWRKTFTYVESPSYEFSPYAIVRQYLTEAAYVEQRMDLDNMGRLKESTVLGNIKQDQTYDNASVVKTRSLPHISGQTAYNVTYHDGVNNQYVFYPEGRRIDYYNGLDSTRIQRNDGVQRTYYYQEDGKIRNVLEQDPATGELNVGTDYYYDALGRLTTISQGVQTRTYTYDAMGRMLTETLPESGTTSYIYDDNSNVVSKTDARGVVTGYYYDELNRITIKSYSDGTPTVNYFYDSQPGDSPIQIDNPIGRLTKMTSTVSGVTVSNFYSYCNCSSVNREAVVINDGTTKTYITSYAHNSAGQLTSITYPNGKVVNYTRDSQGRETKVSSTYNGQAFNYISGALYEGPQGALTKIDYPINWPYSDVEYTYNRISLNLSIMRLPGMILHYNYTDTSGNVTNLIQDVTNQENPGFSEHYAYDKWDRLTGYWISANRTDTPSRKLEMSYDRYGNIASTIETINGMTQTYSFSVDPTTNRLLSRIKSGGTATFSYDAAGNMTSKGTFDAENRLRSNGGIAYLYDGNGRRFRKQGGSIVNYIYSYSGQLLVEDNVTTSTTENHISFAGQVLAIQGQQDGTFKALYKDRLGSTIKSFMVTLPNYTTSSHEQFKYDAWGQIWYSQQLSPYTNYKYEGKERENNLDNFGARYYDSTTIANGSSMRWISPDPVTSNIYDPQSLNKYTYVRNDPVNLVDPDGRDVTTWGGWYLSPGIISFMQWFGGFLSGLPFGFGPSTTVVVTASPYLVPITPVVVPGISGIPGNVAPRSPVSPQVPRNSSPGTIGFVGPVRPKDIAAVIPSNVKNAICASVTASNSKDESVGDTIGGYHETGGSWITNANGSIVPGAWVPGKADLKVSGAVRIALSNFVNPHFTDNMKYLNGEWHVHPKGTYFEKYWGQGPDQADYDGAGSGINIVIGAKDQTVTFYGKNNRDYGSMSLKDFGCPKD